MSKPAVYSEAQVRRWLHWLARNMQKQQQTIFMVERLQPTWLLTRRHQWLYLLVSRTLEYTGVTLAYLLLLTAWIQWTAVGQVRLYTADYASTLELSLTLGVVLGLAAVFTAMGKGNQGCIYSLFTNTFWIGGLLISLILMLFTSAPLNQSSYGGAVLTLLGIVSGGSTFVMVIGREASRTLDNDVQPVERISWSFRRFYEGLKEGLLYGFGGWIGIAFLAFPFGLALAALMALLWPVALFGILIWAFFAAVKPQDVQLKTLPNMGIRLSFRSAIVLLLPALAMVGVAGVWNAWAGSPNIQELPGPKLGQAWIWSVIAPDGWRAAIEFLGILPLTIMIYFSAWFGGIDFINHFVLRAMLRLCGYAPLNYPRFLDYAATELGFLQKVGGGYIFMHRYLQEYFAGAEEEDAADAAGLAAEQPAV